MATVIDSLLVTLGLDSSNFKKGADEADKAQEKLTGRAKKDSKERRHIQDKEADERKKHHREFRKESKESIQSIRQIRNQALSTLAVFTGGLGMVAFAKSTIFTSAALGRMSQNIGLSVKEIAGYQGALKSLGGSSQDANALLGKAASSIGSLRAGQPPDSMMQTYLRYGGKTGHGEMTNTRAFLHGLASEMQRLYKENPQKALSIAQAMGLSSSAFNLLKQGPGAVDKLVASYSHASGMTEKLAHQSAVLQKNLAMIETKLQHVGITLMTALMPTIKQVVAKLQEFSDWANQHGPDITAWIRTTSKAIAEFARDAGDAVKAIGGWKMVFAGLIAMKFAPMIASLVRLAGALTGVSAGLAGIAGQTAGMAMLGRLGLLGAAGAAGYETGKHVIKPLLDKGINKATGGVVKDFSDWINMFLLDQLPGASSSNARAHSQYRVGSGSAASGKIIRNTSSSEAHVGAIHIHTQATDADGIANELIPAFGKYGVIFQSDTGMQ